MKYGIIRSLSVTEDIGIITDVNFQDITFRISTLIKYLEKGTRVQYQIELLQDGLWAVNVIECIIRL